ncbi:nucleotide exchange factor GrpE [Candidatus Poriferisodalis sp.]|uniref:nucleotide exchange factor GrpE n=1 Tax=Candidatus Poriferisodalis sp. TaxID=3101277 RepID=UPI003B01854D
MSVSGAAPSECAADGVGDDRAEPAVAGPGLWTAPDGESETAPEAAEPASAAPPADASPAGEARSVPDEPDLSKLPSAVELAAQLDAVMVERDDYLDQLQRQRAEFQNFRKRVEAERSKQVAAGVSRLVESLLPVLDGCDEAEAQGHTEVAAVGQSLMVALAKAGLERIDAVGEAFDPTVHAAVAIEEAPSADPADPNGAADRAPACEDDSSPEDPSSRQDAAAAYSAAVATQQGTSDVVTQVVTEELRSGFRFDGRVLRAAMVKVRTG